MYGKKNGVAFEDVLPYHNCTDADWAEFPPPSKASKDAFESITSDPKRGMFCIDWSKERLIYGNENNQNFQRIDILMNPCNYLHTHIGYEGDTIDPECIADLEKQIEYLGPLDFMLYYTEGIFVQRSYGSESIQF